MYRQLEKKLVKQQYVVQMSQQYGELRPTSSWDRFVTLGHPTKFQLRYCTACSSGRQPNFVALNRGRHLCLAGWPSCWAWAHIPSCFIFSVHGQTKIKFCMVVVFGGNRNFPISSKLVQWSPRYGSGVKICPIPSLLPLAYKYESLHYHTNCVNLCRNWVPQ